MYCGSIESHSFRGFFKTYMKATESRHIAVLQEGLKHLSVGLIGNGIHIHGKTEAHLQSTFCNNRLTFMYAEVMMRIVATT